MNVQNAIQIIIVKNFLIANILENVLPLSVILPGYTCIYHTNYSEKCKTSNNYNECTKLISDNHR